MDDAAVAVLLQKRPMAPSASQSSEGTVLAEDNGEEHTCQAVGGLKNSMEINCNRESGLNTAGRVGREGQHCTAGSSASSAQGSQTEDMCSSLDTGASASQRSGSSNSSSDTNEGLGAAGGMEGCSTEQQTQCAGAPKRAHVKPHSAQITAPMGSSPLSPHGPPSSSSSKAHTLMGGMQAWAYMQGLKSLDMSHCWRVSPAVCVVCATERAWSTCIVHSHRPAAKAVVYGDEVSDTDD